MSESAESLLALEIEAQPRALQSMRHRLAEALTDIPLPKGELEQLVLAVNEACMNVIQHAYREPAGKLIRLRVTREPALLRFVIEDDAPCIDPGCVKSRDLSDVRPGGLGVHFIREIMDGMQFHRCGQRGNRLELVKRLDHIK